MKGNVNNNYSELTDINVDYRGQTQHHSDTDACSLGDTEWVLKQSLTRLSLLPQCGIEYCHFLCARGNKDREQCANGNPTPVLLEYALFGSRVFKRN